MKLSAAFLAIVFIALCACKKTNNISKIPEIIFLKMQPDTIQSGSSDTVFIYFNFADGDADLGNEPNGPDYDIYIEDSRYDTGFAGHYFPSIDKGIEDPNKGITGTAIFKQLAALLQPRDSVHMLTGDTLHYRLFIKDRAGHNSDTITTSDLFLIP